MASAFYSTGAFAPEVPGSSEVDGARTEQTAKKKDSNLKIGTRMCIRDVFRMNR